MDKYLSIITNFECHYNCPYCIVKNNNLHIPKTTLHGLSMARKAFDMRIGTRVSSESFQT